MWDISPISVLIITTFVVSIGVAVHSATRNEMDKDRLIHELRIENQQLHGRLQELKYGN